MKLVYWKERFNFGDQLNPWLWTKLLPGFFDESEDVSFIGIGTLLNDNLVLPKNSRKLVFGSGVGYFSGIPNIDDTWTIYCVRGPQSAKALGISSDLAIADPAILAMTCLEPNSASAVNRFSFIPHWEEQSWAWRWVCKELGIAYIDPQSPVEKVLSEIQSTQVLLAEAMHGAIVADALRIPWIPVVTHSGILSSKWEDWCASMEIHYKPNKLPFLSDLPRYPDLFQRGHSFCKRRFAKWLLARLLSQREPMLSREDVLLTRVEQLQRKLHSVKSEFG